MVGRPSVRLGSCLAGSSSDGRWCLLLARRELFCFRKPYMEHDPINMAYLVAHEDLRPPLLEHIPEILQRLMAACWHADPAQRPSFTTVVFLLEEAKNAVPAALAIDQAKPFAEAAAALHRHAKYPRKSYGLTSGML